MDSVSVSKQTIIHRIRSVAGHVKSVEGMVADGRYRVDVINKLRGASGTR